MFAKQKSDCMLMMELDTDENNTEHISLPLSLSNIGNLLIVEETDDKDTKPRVRANRDEVEKL